MESNEIKQVVELIRDIALLWWAGGITYIVWRNNTGMLKLIDAISDALKTIEDDLKK